MKDALTVPTRLIHAKPDTAITSTERRVAWELATILDEMRQAPDIDDVVWLTVPTARLRGPLGRDDNRHLHQVLGKLAKVQWSGQDPDGTRYVCQLIAQAEITPTGDQVKLLMPPRAVRFLRTPGNFAELDRAAAYSLTGNARTLYGLLKNRFNDPDKLTNLNAMWSLDEFKGLLGLGGRYENRFDHFKARVIEPCVKAINDTGSLSISWQPVRNGRSVSAVIFTLRRKEPEEAEAKAAEAKRHSKARGKHQTAADAPPMVPENDAARALAWVRSLPGNDATLLKDRLPSLPPGKWELAAWEQAGRPAPVSKGNRD